MTGRDYLVTQIQLIELGKRVSKLNLDEFLFCMEKAQVESQKIPDPQVRQRITISIEAMKKLVSAFQTVKAEFAGVEKAVTETTLAYLVKKEEKTGV